MFIITEDEYWESEQNNEDDEILGDFLMDEFSDDDLTLIMMPKIDYDFDVEFENYYKVLKRCKTKEQIKGALSGIIGHATDIAILKHEISFLQERAKELEFNISMMQQEIL